MKTSPTLLGRLCRMAVVAALVFSSGCVIRTNAEGKTETLFAPVTVGKAIGSGFKAVGRATTRAFNDDSTTQPATQPSQENTGELGLK